MNLHIDRLTLRAGDLSDADARHLPRLVAERLAAASNTPGAAADIDRLRLSVILRPGEPLEATAQRLATEMLYALARSP
ncbi:MAG: hypothetical protein IPK78_20010 [Rhodospirillales bacterium]|nr:hypothetical protein [Rhodospirillales bacterium]